MKIAYIHDWLIFPGGWEEVFFDIVNNKLWWSNNIKKEILEDYYKINPNTWNKHDKKIFTTFQYNKFKNESNLDIESVIKGKYIKKYYRHLMPFFPFFMKKLSSKIRKFNPDIAIISSFAIAKNLDLGTHTKKILYLHSPMQYIRSHYDEYAKKIKKWWWLKYKIYQYTSKKLRRWDMNYNKFDEYYFNSNYTKKCFENTYGTKIDKAQILNPLVKIPNYKEISIKDFSVKEKEYFIYIGRLVKFVKHVDIIIKAFNQTWDKLVIVGDGPDKEYLQSIANKNIIFAGYIWNQEEKYRNLLEKSKALVNITKESFWIVTKQALKLGIPVIWLNKWATPELEGEKILIEEVNEKNLIKAIKKI